MEEILQMKQLEAVDWTLKQLKWALQGELTMEKWDKLALVLKEQNLNDLLNNIYISMEKTNQKNTEIKYLLLDCVREWEKCNPDHENIFVNYIIEIFALCDLITKLQIKLGGLRTTAKITEALKRGRQVGWEHQ